MTYDDVEAYLMADGNLRVPASRYGWDTRSCVPIAEAVATIIAGETGTPIDKDLLDYVMGLVVNDHSDVEELLIEYGWEYGYNYADFVETGGW